MAGFEGKRHTTITVCLVITILSVIITGQQTPLLDANQFMEELQLLANEKLGVQEMQNYFNTLSFERSPIEGRNLVEELKTALNQKFLDRINALRKIKDAVEEMYEQPQGTFQQCCQVDLTHLEFNSRYGRKLDPNTVCTRISPNAEPNSRHFSNEVVEVMKENFRQVPTLKWQYYNSEEGVFTIYPANKLDSCTDGYDGRFRPWYVETVSPEPKNLVLVIDKSGSMKERFGSKTLIQIAIDSAFTVLDTLNPSDKIGVVTFSSDENTLGRDSNDPDYLGCFSEQLAQATLANTNFLKDFIGSLRPEGHTHYSKAFRAAFNLLKQTYHSSSEDQSREQVILFLTDGEPTDSKVDIMREIKTSNEEMGNSVVILTVGLGTDSGLGFLEDIAKQNYAKYGLDTNDTTVGDIQEGQFTHVVDYTKLRNTMARYYDFFANTEKLGDEPIFSVPYQDAFGLGLMTTAAIPVKYDGVLKGAVGTDFTIDDLLGEITYFRQGQRSYAFIYEAGTAAEGRAIMHPLLPAPATIADDPVYAHISTLERNKEFFDIVFYNSTNGQLSGETTFISSRSLPRGNAEREGVYTTSVESTYYWRHITESPYVLCLVKAVDDHQQLLRQLRPTGKDFLYHRIDIKPPPSSCIHANRHATQDQSVVKYSPKAFSDPVEYLELDEDETTIQRYSDYMNDATWNVRNEYFSPGVKDMTTATAKVNTIWRKNQTNCEDYTLYLYIGTSNGVFRVYPGVVMNDLYDHTVRPWYERAKSNKGALTLSAPYEDANGAGYIITLSKAILVHNTNTIDATSDDVIAVMGLDFTLTYFYNLLTKNYPVCKQNRYRCFVMDTSGYLIVHKNFFSDEDINVEYLHITKQEPHIAQDLIDEGILSRTACKDFQLIRDYHYYTAEPSSGKHLINKLNGPEPCKRYQLEFVKETNAYVGIVDTAECNYPGFSCACYYERCQVVGHETCECPCLSLTRYDYCNDRYTFTSDDDPACTPGSPSLSPVIEELDAYAGLDYCCEIDCASYSSFSDCSRFVGCSWDDNTRECQSEQIHSFSTPSPSIDGPSLPTIIGISCGVVIFIVIVAIIVWKVRVSRSVPQHQSHVPKTESQVTFPQPDVATTMEPVPTAPTRDIAMTYSSDHDYYDNLAFEQADRTA